MLIKTQLVALLVPILILQNDFGRAVLPCVYDLGVVVVGVGGSSEVDQLGAAVGGQPYVVRADVAVNQSARAPMAASAAAWARSTSSYSVRCGAVKRPLAG